jgi:hypothetical protein
MPLDQEVDQVEPTSRPWILKEQGEANQYCFLNDKNQWVIAILHNGEALVAKQRANLKFMAKAVNSHDDMMNLLVKARSLTILETRPDGAIVIGPEGWRQFQTTLTKLRETQ